MKLPNPVIPDEAKQAQSVVEALLGESIIGIYLFGSAVVGGLKRDSDIDILVAVDDPLALSQRMALIAQLMSVSGAIGSQGSARPVELTVITPSAVVPWHFPPCAELIYGEWLRKKFEAGYDPERVRDPDLAIVLKQAIDSSLALYGPRAAEIFEPVPATDIRRAIRASLPHLLTETAGDERNVILTLARMWFTAVTGEIVPKDTAATWAAKQVPAEHAALMHYARAGYLGQIQDRWEENRDDFKALVSCMKQLIEASLGACWRENL